MCRIPAVPGVVGKGSALPVNAKKKRERQEGVAVVADAAARNLSKIENTPHKGVFF